METPTATKPDDPNTQTPATTGPRCGPFALRTPPAFYRGPSRHWCCCVIILPCYHVVMLSCFHASISNISNQHENQCAWCLEARKPLCVKCMCGSERPNCVCVCLCVLHAKKTQQLWKNMCGHGTADSPHHPTSECWEADPCRPTPQSLEEQNNPRKAKKNFA